MNTKIIVNKAERKLWLLPDKNINFRNMYNLINHLESLPINKYTLKQSNSHNDKNKIKLTKKNITI